MKYVKFEIDRAILLNRFTGEKYNIITHALYLLNQIRFTNCTTALLSLRLLVKADVYRNNDQPEPVSLY